ncbi:UNVERIFIED_CONTAM: Retrovirus-related Pol polyprotein from transposon TNT 1-94 [Sesamum radiatum]|uniref:Retrovirus-related Pol polyprotein from transposon TNT 1-94 n=1 Tax=Sesamum radiatum TaxID=300843 RepID=A0AAW2SJM6_SESRA
MSTPLANHFKLSLEQCPKTAREIENMAKVPYASAFGCLIYLKGTVGHGVIFGRQRNDPLVVRYVDSDYVGDLDDRRSKTGYVFTLGGGLICWKSTVQSILASSTAEAEYMAVTEAAKEALWLNGLAKELGVEQGGVQLYCDSQSAICLAKNQVYHVRIKHTDSRYHKIRELIASGGITLQKFATSLLVSVLFHFN